MLRPISARTVGVGAEPDSSSAMRMRARGERSSCEALASSDFCERSSAVCESIRLCTRSAASLKRRDRSATSSCPPVGSRTDRSPSPQRCTPRCRPSSRCVRRRATGNTPIITTRPASPSTHRKPNGGRSQPMMSAGRWMRLGGRGRGICSTISWPSCSVTTNSTPPGSPGVGGTRRAWASAVPMTAPAASRTTTSREGGFWRSRSRCSSALCHAHPTTRLSTATLPATASQMRRYSLRAIGLGRRTRGQSCCLANT